MLLDKFSYFGVLLLLFLNSGGTGLPGMMIEIDFRPFLETYEKLLNIGLLSLSLYIYIYIYGHVYFVLLQIPFGKSTTETFAKNLVC